MKKKYLFITLLFTIIICLSGWIVYKHNSNETNAVDSPSSNTADNEVYIKESKYPNVGIKKEVYHSDSYDIYINFPVFLEDNLNTKVQEYIEEQKREFDTLIADSDTSSDIKMTLNVSFDIYQIYDKTYSIKMNTFTQGKVANPIYSNKIMLIDTANNQFVNPIDVFKDNKKDQLKKEVQQKTVDQYSEEIFEDELQKAIDSEAFLDYLYFTDDEVVIEFPQYTIAPGSSGMLKVDFSYNELSDLFVDEWIEEVNRSSNASQEVTDKKIKDESETNTEKESDTSDEDLKQVAFTFDDGPHPENTEKILEILDEYDAKATFFVLGNSVDYYPQIVKKAYLAGHEIGNHSWNHPNLVNLPFESIRKEIFDTDEVIKKATGEAPKLYRPPYGSHNQTVDEAAGKPPILWDVDTLDWQNHDPQAILTNVKNQTKDGSIILMHDIHNETVEGFRLSIEYLDSLGYEFVTVSELEENNNE